jgi:hypothetical protein
MPVPDHPSGRAGLAPLVLGAARTNAKVALEPKLPPRSIALHATPLAAIPATRSMSHCHASSLADVPCHLDVHGDASYRYPSARALRLRRQALAQHWRFLFPAPRKSLLQ